MNHMVLKLFVAVVASLLAPLSIAVEFGPLQLQSTLGEPLVAELDVRAQSGDVLNPKCIKVFVPSGNYPPLVAGVEISWQSGAAGAAGTSLLVRSAEALVDPAMRFALEANCGAGRSWQEFAVLLHPAARAVLPAHRDEWLLAPGETPLSLAQLLYPGQRGAQRRFIKALAAANPGLVIDDSGAPVLAAGTPLQMPDWRMLAGSGRGGHSKAHALGEAGEISPTVVAARRESDDPPLIAAPPRSPTPRARDIRHDHGALTPARLRLSTVLAPRQDASEPLRQMLRLEYRLLTSLNEQLSALHAGSLLREASATIPVAEPPVRLQSAARLPAAGTLADAATPVMPVTPVPAPAALPVTPPSAAPTKIPQAPAAIAPEVSEGLSGWVYYAGLGAGVLALLAFLRRRRDLAPPQDFAVAETVVMDAAPASKGEMEALFAAPEVQPTRTTKAVSLPPPVDKGDPNPVMELAEIMLSFGRIQGAAQTLQEYIEANPNEALQPWFKLLEVYRVGDMHAEFDTLAQKLNRNFNVELQHWDADAASAPIAPATPADAEQQAKALSLEEIPHIRERLVACWGTPDSLDYLHQLLRDNRSGQRSGFTLPVVQEILLLIDILVAQSVAGNH